MEINKDVGLRIRECRKSQKISLRALADRVGLHFSTLCKYENGDITNVDLEAITKFSKALNVSVEYLLGIEKLGKANAERRWREEVGTEDFSKEELDEIIKYAKYLISQREQ